MGESSAAPAPSPSSEGRLAALVSLLTDEAPKVRDAAEVALRASGLPAARLRALAESIDDPGRRARARAAIESVRFFQLEEELRALCRGEPDLERGALLLARLEHDDQDVAKSAATLDEMAAHLKAEVQGAPPREGARRLRHFLHDIRGFRGAVDSYDDPDNALLDRVLDRRVGIPTSLGIVYLLLARRLGVPLEGVNLPLHFLLRCPDGQDELFVDAFARGRFLTRDDCREFLRGAGIEEKAEFFRGASDREVLLRLARSLVSAYRARGSAGPLERVSRFLGVLAPESPRASG